MMVGNGSAGGDPGIPAFRPSSAGKMAERCRFTG